MLVCNGILFDTITDYVVGDYVCAYGGGDGEGSANEATVTKIFAWV